MKHDRFPFLKAPARPASAWTLLLLALAWLPAKASQDAAVRWSFGRLADVMTLDAEHEQVRRGEQMSVAVPRSYAMPGERWNDVLVVAHPDPRFTGGHPASVQFVASVYDVLSDSAEPLARLAAEPAAGWPRQDVLRRARAAEDPGHVLLRVDLLRLGLERARVRIEMRKQAGSGGKLIAAEEILLTRQAHQPPQTGRRIPVKLDLPEGIDRVQAWPAVFGVPLPAGALWKTDGVRLVDGRGRQVPSQQEVAALWAEEGSIQWLRFDALVDSAEELFVEFAAPQEQTEAPRLQLEERGGALIADTGPARFELAPGASPIRSIALEGRQVASAGPRGLYVIDQNGRVASASARTEMQIESRGPVAASVRFEGFYETPEGEPLARHITRVELYAGRPEARITHTFILTRDTNELWFREVGWEFDVSPGIAPGALFGTSREDWQASEQVKLEGDRAAAYLFQADHVQFRGGKNSFVLASVNRDGRSTMLTQGAEMGDWAALQGPAGGLMIACKEAARQHPKEFEASAGRLVLRLFSNRAGEELDFRPPALVERWNRGGMMEVRMRGGLAAREPETLIERALNKPTNAVGWARSHELIVAPAAASDSPLQLARLSRLNSSGLYAISDPQWLYETRAMGPLYPRDRDRFPTAEAFIERAFEAYYARGHERDGEYGFVDYFAGPHYREIGQYRYHHSYRVRPSAWVLYARSGDRRLREFASGTYSTYMDGRYSHWGSPDDPGAPVIRGMYNNSSNYWPEYWGGNALGPQADQAMVEFYLLTGYRRAADVVREYNDGLKRGWRPRIPVAYPESLMRNVMATYRFTWDPELRAILETQLQAFYDPKAAVFVHPPGGPDRIRNHNTYKSTQHLGIPIFGWEFTGDRRFLNIANGWSWANYYGYSYPESRLGMTPPLGRFEKGRTAHFLYGQTGRAHLAEEMFLTMLKSVPGDTNSISSINYHIQGIAYGLALIAETNVDRESLAAWVAYDDSIGDGPVRIITKKADLETQDFYAYGVENVIPLGGARSPLHRLTHRAADSPAGAGGSITHVQIPRDSMAGDYELAASAGVGYKFVFSDGRHPLVIHAPGYWQPAPVRAVKYPTIYFRVPDDAQSPSLHLSGSARLVGPDGQPWLDGQVVSGAVPLPRPGLWGFEPVDNKPVRVENAPPFFAFRDPAFHFIPASLAPGAGTDADDGE